MFLRSDFESTNKQGSSCCNPFGSKKERNSISELEEFEKDFSLNSHALQFWAIYFLKAMSFSDFKQTEMINSFKLTWQVEIEHA